MEHPIIFSGEMVRAILEGRKTQTRRVARFKPLHEGLNFAWTGLKAGHYCTGAPEHGWVLRARRGDGCWEDKTERAFCPYGGVGDGLWARETWADVEPVRYRADLYRSAWKDTDQVWKPSIFMPRWASRLALKVAAVRVERVQSISNADAQAEGVGWWQPVGGEKDYRLEYALLWDRINAKRGYPWSANPWVWAITFSVQG